MREGKLSNGFQYKMKEDNLNNWELMEIMDEFEENPTRIVRIAKMLLDEDNYKALKQSCTVDGIVQTDQMITLIFELLEAEGETKN